MTDAEIFTRSIVRAVAGLKEERNRLPADHCDRPQLDRAIHELEAEIALRELARPRRRATAQ